MADVNVSVVGAAAVATMLAVLPVAHSPESAPFARQSATSRPSEGLVQVPVVVRDAESSPVRGLPSDAFDVFEAGRRMTLVSVEEVRRDPAQVPYAPREVLLVVDDLNTRPEVMPRATMAARALLDQLDPRDRVALLNTSGQPEVALDFTTTRSPLVQALTRVRGQQHASDWTLSILRSRQGLGVVRGVLERLRQDASGRRRLSLVLFSEGYGIAAAEQSGLVDRELLQDVRTVVGLAALANVAIYAVDPSGIESERRAFRATGSRAVGPAAAMRRAGVPVSSSLTAPDDLSALGALAHDTGGRLTRWTNDLLVHVSALLSDADEFYLLTWEMPGVTDRDRKSDVPHVRQLDVRVRLPNVSVRARQGYVHPRALP